jgi:hypothetical protein
VIASSVGIALACVTGDFAVLITFSSGVDWY